jgi:hypothetical protein
MAPERRGIRWPVALLALAALAGAVAVAVRWVEREAAPMTAAKAPPEVGVAPRVAPPAAAAPARATTPVPTPDEPAAGARAGGPEGGPAPPGSPAEAGEERVFEMIDLEAAREALPDNLYWENAAPTQDPRLLDERERAKVYWNEQYGKLLSGTGSEEEIRAYFDRRMRLSSDYVRFVDYVLEHQGSALSEQDLELLQLARRLQLARLQEVPRKMQEAFERKAEQDAAREAWLAEQRELEGAQGEPSEGEVDVE